MSAIQTSRTVVVDDVKIDLKIPAVAAFWAWLIPGAGHYYQRRYRKSLLFALCIILTYLMGMILGGGKVVYAKWDGEEKRWPFLCQIGAGAITFPAVIQAYRKTKRQEPILGGFMAPPDARTLSNWNKDLAAGCDIGTLYTMVAGLMNFLVIFDAYLGPLPMPVDNKGKSREKDEATTESEKSAS